MVPLPPLLLCVCVVCIRVPFPSSPDPFLLFGWQVWALVCGGGRDSNDPNLDRYYKEAH